MLPCLFLSFEIKLPPRIHNKIFRFVSCKCKILVSIQCHIIQIRNDISLSLVLSNINFNLPCFIVFTFIDLFCSGFLAYSQICSFHYFFNILERFCSLNNHLKNYAIMYKTVQCSRVILWYIIESVVKIRVCLQKARKKCLSNSKNFFFLKKLTRINCITERWARSTWRRVLDGAMVEVW